MRASKFTRIGSRYNQPQRAFLIRLAFLICVIVSFSKVYKSTSRIPSLLETSSSETTASQTLSPRVHIWQTPQNCQNATVASPPARDSERSFPYFILRDAAVDNRPASNRVLGKSDPPGTRRLILYLTVHLSNRLSMNYLNYSITAKVSHPALSITPEYVLEVCPALVPKVPKGHRPALRTRYGREAVEWQLGIRVSPSDPNQPQTLEEAVRQGAVANLTIPAHRYDGESFLYNIAFPLRCALGWDVLPPIIPSALRSEPICDAGGAGASSTVLLSGSSLYGSKKRDPKHFKEVAHFAARALRGAVRFQAVIMSVVTDFSAADIALKCGADMTCAQGLEKQNMDLLHRVARVVETEFAALGLPEELRARVVLVPTCRLGSDAANSEKDDPCQISHRYGQYHATFFAYGVIAPYFKWAVSYDMDEYISKLPNSLTDQRPQIVLAEQLLDETDRKVGGKSGDLMFSWLNFRVQDRNTSFALSRNILQGQYARLEHREDSNLRGQCYGKAKSFIGKSAVRCDVGLGFTIHRPIILIGHGAFQKQGIRVAPDVRTWHARLGSSAGHCDFAEQN